MTAAIIPKRAISASLVAGLGVAVCALLIAGYFLVFSPKEYAALYTGLRPAAAAPIVAELKKQQVEYRLENGGADISVPAQSVDAIRLSIVEADLPTSGVDGFELFDASDLGLTEFAQKIKFQRALQGELTRTILMMEGIVDARVHIALPEKSLFRGDESRAKASVTLITQPDAVLSSGSVDGVQQLVASSMPDLAKEDVVVLNGDGQVMSVNLPSPAPGTIPLASTGSEVRPDLAAKVLETLASVLPAVILDVELTSPTPQTAQQLESNAPVFALKVLSSRAVTESEQQQMRAVLEKSALLPRETLVSFQSAPPEPLGQPLATPPFTSPAVSAERGEMPAAHAPAEVGKRAQPARDDSGLIWTVAGAIAVLAAIAAAGAAAARRFNTRPPRLALEDQSRFAQRLKLGLAEEVGVSDHAA